MAQVLTALGAASAEERALVEKYRTETLIARARACRPTLGRLVVPPGRKSAHQPDLQLDRASGVGGSRHGFAPRQEAPPAAPSARPGKATAAGVAALPWAAAILGLAAPPMYLEKERDSGYALIPGVPPFLTIGKRVFVREDAAGARSWLAVDCLGTVRSTMCGRCSAASTDFKDLFLAALTIDNPGLPIAEDMKRRVAPSRRRFNRCSKFRTSMRCAVAFLRFVEEGGRTNLQRWSSATDKDRVPRWVRAQQRHRYGAEGSGRRRRR